MAKAGTYTLYAHDVTLLKAAVIACPDTKVTSPLPVIGIAKADYNALYALKELVENILNEAEPC
jgi:hypothetical protein